MAASGFHLLHPKIRTNGILRNSPFTSTGAKKTSASTLMATPQEEQAVAEFKMITEDESRLRKIGGVAIGIVTTAMYVTQDQSYSSLSSGIFASIATYRSGSEYQ